MSTENTGSTDIQLSQPTTSTEVTFGNKNDFEHAQRVAMMLSKSSLIPKDYQSSIPNTMIALEMANRVGCSPLMVMQNLYVVHGKPSWSGSFVIAAINSCGRFTPLRFEMSGSGATLSCRAWANDKKTGERLNGTTVTMAMADGEGWVNKPGSKWKTMPEQMIQYRAGAFFGRLYAPDILMGMPMAEEVEDFTLMMDDQQEQVIENLIATSTYDEVKIRGIKWQIGNGISQREAAIIIGELRLNQLESTETGNFSVTDGKKKVGQLL